MGVSANEQLAEELHHWKFKKPSCKENIRVGYLTEMESLFSQKKNVKHLLCVIYFFTKFTLIKHLKYEKRKTVLNAFI